MRKFLLAAVIGAAAVSSAAVASEQAPGAYMVVIPVGDLDLTTPAGAAALRDRAARIAGGVCLEDVRPLRSRRSVELCRTDFMNKVDRRIERASQRAQLSR